MVVQWAERSDVICVNRLSKAIVWARLVVAVGCSNRFIKGSGVHFPQDEERKSQWIAAVGPAQRLDSK